MATTKQKEAARRSLTKARAAGKRAKPKSRGMSTAEQNDLPKSAFAFPDARKEPLTDAAHVRNAIARFDQVEEVSDAERDRAWRRIKTAAKNYDIEIETGDWRDLFVSGQAKR